MAARAGTPSGRTGTSTSRAGRRLRSTRPTGLPNRCPQTTHPDQHRRRSARSTARPISSSATTAVSIGGRSTAGQRERQRDRLAEPERRHHRRPPVLRGRRRHGRPRRTRRRRPATASLVSGGLQDNGGSIVQSGGDQDELELRRRWRRRPRRPEQRLQHPAGVRGPRARGHPDLRPPVGPECDHRPVEVDHRSMSPRRTSRPASSRRSRPMTRTSTTGSPAATASGSRTKGFAIRSGSEWQKVYDLRQRRPGRDRGRLLGRHGHRGLVRPLQQRRLHPRGGRRQRTTARTGHGPSRRSTGVPNRYIGGVTVDRHRQPVPRDERLQPAVHRGPGGRHRSHLQVDAMAARPGATSAATSPTSRPTASRCWRTGRSSLARTSASSIDRR